MRSKRFIYINLLLLLAVMQGCKIATPVERSTTTQLPETFTGSTDTNSIGYSPWREFFEDEHLISLIDTALRNNYDVLTAVQRVEIARANLQMRRYAFLPSVAAVATAGVEKFGDYTLNGVGNYDTNLSEKIRADQKIPNPTPDFFLGLRSTWELDIWGELKNKKKAAYFRYLSSQKGKQLVQTALVAHVASLYYQLLTTDSELKIIRENIKLQETALELVKVQKSAGRATELAVQQFKAQLLNTRGLEAQVIQDQAAIENELNLLLGRYPQPIQRGEPILAQQLPDEIKTGIPSQMLSRRPDIQQAALELRAANADVYVARAAFFPSVTISPFVGLNSFNAAKLFDPASLAYGVLGGLTAPIMNRKQIKASYAQAQAANLETYYTYQKTVLKGYQEAATSLSNIYNMQKVSELKAEEVAILQQAVATSKDLFSAGYASYLEVVTAQKSVLEAELSLINARNKQFISLIELYRALGGGWE